ncbi:MAG: rhomboid family intramembrane serine protease [Flavobacteriales bacterium]|nr:rhomboid family intramembrane serine protease [Flavobacteriales bacterium]
MSTTKRYSSFLFPALFIILIWAVKFYELNSGIRLSEFGLKPKDIEGLRGILLMPFLHGGPLTFSKEAFDHIAGNSIPLLFLGTTVFFFYREVATKVILWSWLMTGVWLWVAGQTGSNHIGASGLVYALASFTFFSGMLRKHYRLMAISLTIVFLYGSMIWGIFPIEPNVSWEGHLFGAIAGAFLAYYYRKIGLQKPVYDWENEEDESTIIENESSNVTINYIYKANNQQDSSIADNENNSDT